jgi:4-hydroxy-L-threonine phosphate dehydrogenase PdxA
VVAMYHDQGHGPIKVLGIEHGHMVPTGFFPHGLAAPGHGRLSTAFPACGCLRLAVATNSLCRGLSR